jgi:hypothetical protein
MCARRSGAQDNCSTRVTLVERYGAWKLRKCTISLIKLVQPEFLGPMHSFVARALQ